ncbi:hypothetical protein SAMN05444161_3130 [Rhizobiales bacterium GAS191]|nr:hypothetical protein SAMN05444161_3130 [Rhizobiales bacterium GAS191]
MPVRFVETRKLCCYNGRHWHKPPAVLGLRALPPISAVDRCYMKELGSCDGGLSGEHLFSQSIMLLLKADGDFSISGLPWLAEGETKIMSPKTLTANCLCQKHNSALSPLDAAALYFFTALKSCLDREAQSARYIVSGHDIERWLLKTAKALAASKNLARGRERLSGAFASDVQVLDMLDDPTRWPDGAGLYCVMSAGDLTENHNRFQLQPYTNQHDEISGVGVNIMGLGFILMLGPLDLALNPQLNNAKYRPGQISVSYPSSTNWIAISWDDGRRHNDTLSLQFLREVGQR